MVQLRHPNLEWATTVNSDAEQLYLGHTLYQNPAHGYAGQVYTPGFPAMVSLLDRVYLWNGWPMLLVLAATVSLPLLAARMAYTRTGPAPRLMYMLGAAGVGGIAYWCVASVGLNLLDEARCDHVAWAFALFGLIVVADFGPRPSKRRVVAGALLLSAGLWTKQTTAPVMGTAFIWVLLLAYLSALNRRSALLFCALAVGVNLLILLVLNLWTHGWEFYFNFELATRQAVEKPFSKNATVGLQNLTLGIGFVAVTWLASALFAATHRRRPTHVSPRRAAGTLRRLLAAEDSTTRRTLLLGIYIVIGFPLAAYFMRKQGTDTNQLLGVAWALGLLAAVGWRMAQRRLAAGAVAGGCLAALFVLFQFGSVGETTARAEIRIPPFEETVQWISIPEELRTWASNHTLWGPLYSDLNVAAGGPLYPNFYNVADILAAGSQPLYLVHALLDRRFEGVQLIPLILSHYASGFGKWEDNYAWKLDEVIVARYAPMPGLPAGVLGPRPGAEAAPWMRHCFGPFLDGGVRFRIHHGGGFWCSLSPHELRFVSSPAPISEVVSEHPVRLSGAITVALANWGHTQVVLEAQSGPAGWHAKVAAAAGSSSKATVTTYLGKTLLGRTLVTAPSLPGGLRGVQLDLTPASGRLGGPTSTARGIVTLTVPASKAPLALLATDGAIFDLHALHLEQ